MDTLSTSTSVVNTKPTTAVFPIERRRVITALGGAAIAGILGRHKPLMAQCPTPSPPALTEGPYFVDEDLSRMDLRVDPSDGSVQAGFPLSLNVNVAQVKDCSTVPLSGAYVDIWHC